MAAVAERAPRAIGLHRALAAVAGVASVGFISVGLGEAAMVTSTLGLAALALRSSAGTAPKDPGLTVMRAIAGRGAASERLDGTVAVSLEELVRRTGSRAALAFVRRGDGGLCDAFSWLDGTLVRDELIWQDELGQPRADDESPIAPRLPNRIGRADRWISRPILARGEVLGALLLLDPPSTARGWLGAVMSVLGTHLGAVALGERFDERLERGYVATIETLVGALEAKDPYTAGHSTRVSQYATAIASEIDFPSRDLADLQTGAVLHDIGKIGVGDGVLTKPGRLSEAEFDEIKDHPRRGARIIDAFNRSSTVLSVVFHHHERYDGRGYPAGLRGVDIPLAARIVNVADAFDAMTTNRPYGNTKTRAEALVELRKGAGSQFDPRVVEALDRAVTLGRV